MILPVNNYYHVELIVTKKQAGSLILQDEDRMPIRKAFVLGVPSPQPDGFDIHVGDVAILKRAYIEDLEDGTHLAHKDFILALWKDGK